MTSVGVAIITHNAVRHLPHCIPPLLASPLHPRVLVVNSSSSDGTVELAQDFGAETLVIPRYEFNHGTTREIARHHLATDIVVMMTPDAYPTDTSLLAKLVDPIVLEKAACSYARQLPRDGATLFESFGRQYNYPAVSHLRTIDDIEKYGIFTFFCSDACAAYSNTALDSIGGFPHVLLGEDTAVCARLLHAGYPVAYVAEATVKHSHSYTLAQEFTRHFDTGLARRQLRPLLSPAGTDHRRGTSYAKELLRHTVEQQPLLAPYAILHLGAKWLGYLLGSASVNAPRRWKKFFSSQDFYWMKP